MRTEDNVVVTTVQGQFEEQQVRAFLEAHGIPTSVRGEALRHTHGLSVAGLGAVEILAPREHAESARRLLQEAERGALRLDDDVEDGGDTPRG